MPNPNFSALRFLSLKHFRSRNQNLWNWASLKCMTNLLISRVLLTRKRKIKHRICIYMTVKFIPSFFLYFHRNAVRTDAGEGRTVSHTVPLPGGAPQKHTCASSFWHKIFPLHSRRRVTADIHTLTDIKPHIYSHGALCHKLDTFSRFIFQKLIRIFYWTQNGICCIAEADVSFRLVLQNCWTRFSLLPSMR